MVIEIKHKNKILNIKLIDKQNRERNSHNAIMEKSYREATCDTVSCSNFLFYISVLALAFLNFALKSLKIGQGILLQVEFLFGENSRFLGFT